MGPLPNIRIIGHTGWFHQATQHVCFFLIVTLHELIQAPAVLGVQGNVIRKSTVYGKTDFLKPLAVVGVSVRTGAAGPAPGHFLGTDRLANFKGLIGAAINRIGGRFDHLPGQLVSQCTRKCRQSRIVDITVRFGLGHVNIAAANAARFNFHNHLPRARFWNGFFNDFYTRVSPNLAAQITQLTVNIL